MSRCDSAAIVSNTSELLPEPDTPVNTVSLRFGISMLTSLRLFSRAPCTRIKSWLSATCGVAGCGSIVVPMVIVSPSVRAGSCPGWVSDQPVAAAHQFAAGHLVDLAPRLDAARGD